MRRWWEQTAGGLPRTFWYLWTGTLINRLGSFVLIYFAFYLTKGRGFSVAFAGVVLGLASAGAAIGVLVGGVLADKWGRRGTMLVANLGTAAVLVALGLVRDPIAIAVLATLFGAANNMVRPAFSATMVDIVPEHDRMRAFTLNYWVINLGFSGAALLAGLLAGVDYFMLFVVNAAAMLLVAGLVFFGVPETKPAGPAVSATPELAAAGAPARSGLGAVFTDGVFLTLVGLAFVTNLVFMQHMSTLPIAAQDDGLSPAAFGVAIAVNGIVIVFGQLFVPKLVGNRDHTHVLVVAALIMGVGFGATALADSVWAYALTVAIWTLGEMLQAPAYTTLTADLSPVALRGSYQGVFALSYSAAGFVGPIAGGWVLQHFGNALWVGCLILAVVTAGGLLAAGPAQRRRMLALRSATPFVRRPAATVTPAPPAVTSAPVPAAEPASATP